MRLTLLRNVGRLWSGSLISKYRWMVLFAFLTVFLSVKKTFAKNLFLHPLINLKERTIMINHFIMPLLESVYEDLSIVRQRVASSPESISGRLGEATHLRKLSYRHLDQLGKDKVDPYNDDKHLPHTRSQQEKVAS